jgi:hypothetical protein
VILADALHRVCKVLPGRGKCHGFHMDITMYGTRMRKYFFCLA